jgi:thiamine-monophosphate kinase
MTSLKDIGEFKLIDIIKKRFKAQSKELVLSIGDDCAVIEKDEKSVNLISTDLLLEGVHFNPDYFTPIQLGMKSAAVNISDIAAMGAVPKFMLVSLAIPKNTSYEFVKGFYTGIKKKCSKYGVNIIGGDTSSSKSGMFISISVIGEAPRNDFLTRKGAKPGDLIYVTGTVGNSAAGLDILLNNHKISDDIKRYLINRHLKVTPRVSEGIFLRKSKSVSSMIDLSDGIGSDIKRICDESGVGAGIYLDMLPVSKYLKSFSQFLNKKVYDFALGGGEDYELLFTVKKDCEESLKAAYKKHFNKKIFKIGVITKTKGVKSIDSAGNKVIISESYNHFLT